ncbi:MAG: hypothetical protein KIT61_08895 [Pyrinomonadaceae bacterium]|nr:hypothetical protein [Blastocatellia bacterium]MCW5956691.1 hypothetical protein [Pyrinomonadaceae bacterium]
MEIGSLQLDTSFCIRLLNENDDLHDNALRFYHYFIEQGIRLKFSTISIAEYCVKGSLEELPLRNLEIIPFNANHAVKAGEFARLTFEKKGSLDLGSRLIIPNDTKLFAQADVPTDVTHFATSDVNSLKMHDLLKTESTISFEMINIRNPYHEELGILPFE